MNVFKAYSYPECSDEHRAIIVNPSLVGGYFNIILGTITRDKDRVVLGHKMIAAYEQDKGAKHSEKYYRHLRKGKLKKTFQSQRKTTSCFNKAAHQLSFTERQSQHNTREPLPSEVEPPSYSYSTVPPTIIPPTVSPATIVEESPVIPPTIAKSPAVKSPLASVMEISSPPENSTVAYANPKAVKGKEPKKKKQPKQTRFAGIPTS